MSNLVKFGSYDMEEADKEQEDLDSGGSGYMKLQTGKNVVRFLPPPMGRRSPFVRFYQHFIKIPGQDRPIVFACPRMQLKKPCRACKRADELKATGNPADLELAKDLFAKRRVLGNVIDRANPEQGPRVLGFGKTVDEALVALRRDEEGGGDYTHPIDGFDIIIERTGTTKNDTKYKVRASRNTSKLATSPEQMNEWIENQEDLEALARVPTEAELAEMWAKVAKGSAPPEDDDDAPRGGGARRTTKRRTAQDEIETEGETVED